MKILAFFILSILGGTALYAFITRVVFTIYEMYRDSQQLR